MKTKHDFPIGSKVRFGRGEGEKTLGTVVKWGRSKLKVRQDEARGTLKSHPVGSVWAVPPSLCTLVADGTSASTPAPAKRKRSEAEILADARRIEAALSPENLHCDGEISFAAARRKASRLRAEFKALERELGRPIKGFDIDGSMPVSLSPRTSAHEYGFRKGQRVSFTAKGGKVVTGFVMRVNTKTVSVKPEGSTDGRYWRVGPSLLRAA